MRKQLVRGCRPRRLGPLRVRLAVWLVAVAVAALVGGGVYALAASGTRSMAGHRRAVRRDAAGLLARVILPSPAKPSSREPAGDGGALSHPGVDTVTDMKLVALHEWWTVPETKPAVYAFLRDHAPARANLIGWSSQGGPTGTEAYVVYAFPPGVGYLPLRQLVVSVAALSGGDAGVRIDAQVQQIIPRPKGERIPGRARVLEVTVGRPGKSPLVSRTVTDPGRVHRIAAMINRLQTEQPEAIDCPSESGHPPAVTFTFRAALHGRVLARAREPADATEPTTPCDPTTLEIEGRHWQPLLGGAAVVHRVQQILGVKLAR